VCESRRDDLGQNRWPLHTKKTANLHIQQNIHYQTHFSEILVHIVRMLVHNREIWATSCRIRRPQSDPVSGWGGASGVRTRARYRTHKLWRSV